MLADADALPVDPRRPLCDLALERFDDRAGALRLRDVLERLIAGWVAARVVGLLELIEVQVEQGRWTASAAEQPELRSELGFTEPASTARPSRLPVAHGYVGGA